MAEHNGQEYSGAARKSRTYLESFLAHIRRQDLPDAAAMIESIESALGDPSLWTADRFPADADQSPPSQEQASE